MTGVLYYQRFMILVVYIPVAVAAFWNSPEEGNGQERNDSLTKQLSP